MESFQAVPHLLFDGVPDSVDPVAVRALLAGLPGVTRVHDLHIWATGTSHVTLTAHLVMPEGTPGDAFLKDATEKLHDDFEITHVTLQVVQAPFMRACDEYAGDGDHV